MKEIACQFGEENRLSGIFTQASDKASEKVLVLINAGLIANHGPFRLYTYIARNIALMGINVFRFDLGDLGASQPNYLHLSLQDRTALEIRAAVDYLNHEFGMKQFYLGGLCSGAEDSFRYAETDTRINGLLMIDPFAYKTTGFASHNIKARIREKIQRLLWLPYDFYKTGLVKRNEKEELIHYQLIKSEEASRIFTTLLRRKVWLHFIYTSGRQEVFNHHHQFWKMFPQLIDYPFVAINYLPQLAHTQMLERERMILIDAIRDGFIQHTRFNDIQDLRH